jgi:hypothetical protein
MALTNEKGGAASALSLRVVFLIAVLLGVLIPAALIGALTLNLQRETATTDLQTDQRRLLDIV